MKRRAIVRRSRDLHGTYRGYWTVSVATAPGGMAGHICWHDTHAEALAHALAEVGLDVPEQHREAP